MIGPTTSVDLRVPALAMRGEGPWRLGKSGCPVRRSGNRSHGGTTKGRQQILPNATAPHLDLYEAAVVKGISVVFSDLDSLWLRMLCAVKPRSREAVRRRRRA